VIRFHYFYEQTGTGEIGFQITGFRFLSGRWYEFGFKKNLDGFKHGGYQKFSVLGLNLAVYVVYGIKQYLDAGVLPVAVLAQMAPILLAALLSPKQP
jgi:hypothetical protein